MPKYLFTNDQRISNLDERIKWVSNYVQSGNDISAIINKSDNNNAATLAFYYNLYPSSEICKAASNNPVSAIRNFILKFQYPNTRTVDSFIDSLSEKTLFAPYRTVISVLCKMSLLSNSISYLSYDEILYFLFCNKEVYTNPKFDYAKLISRIEEHRRTRSDLSSLISSLLQWKQYKRQIQEMMVVLKYGYHCFSVKNNRVIFDPTGLTFKSEKSSIEEIVNYKKFWIPSDSSNFSLSSQEYTNYMDTSNTPYQVVDFNSAPDVVNSDVNLESLDPDQIETLYFNYVLSVNNKRTAINYRWGLRNSDLKDLIKKESGFESIYNILDVAKIKQLYNDVLPTEFNKLTKFTISSAVNKYYDFLLKYLNEELSVSNYDFGSLQKIFYGAPGTGKSHDLNEEIIDQEVIRTTFHPDSDYSTFVGAYKPSMEGAVNNNQNYSLDALSGKLQSYYNDKNTGKIEGIQKFCYEFYDYIDGDFNTIDIGTLVSKSGLSSNYSVEIRKYVDFCKQLPKKSSRIVYKFIPQALTIAYVKAWKDLKTPVFLVIEEINRGNCAQIFGDIFQLLDRGEDGYSSYLINPDEDLKKHLNNEFSSGIDKKAPGYICSGEKMCFPPNLYIWATMNTSDQSLFPIDSAFKRRWDWKYIPIDTHKEVWSILVNGTNYDWCDFLDIINEKIYDKTQSEDKMLGFYFCKAKENIISADKFVSKVLFYLWNDVFKDYGFDDPIFNDEKGKLSFHKFYISAEMVNEEKIERFLKNLGVRVLEEISDYSDDDPDEGIGVSPSVKHKHLESVSFPDGTKFSSDELTRFNIFKETLKKIGLDKVLPISQASSFNRKGFKFVSETDDSGVLLGSNYSYVKEGDVYILKGANDDSMISVLNEIKNELDLDFVVDYK